MGLRQLLAVFAPEAKMKKIELVLEIGDSLDRSGVRVIRTDHVRLGQIMTNLVSNAMRFTELSASRRIVVSLDVSFLPPLANTCVPPPVGQPTVSGGNVPVWLFVAVRDTGPGLRPEECAVLFQQFSREYREAFLLTGRGQHDGSLTIWRLGTRLVHLQK